MATFDTLVTRTIGRLTGAVGRDTVNVLASAMADATGTAVTLTYDADVRLSPGSVIEIEYEQMLVVAQPTTTTLTVLRGFNGTTAATHALGKVITIEPRFPRQAVLDVLAGQAQGLPTGLFATDTVTVTFPANTNTVELVTTAAVVERIVEAVRVDPTNDEMLRPPVELVRDPDHEYFASGYGVALGGVRSYSQTTDVQVTFAVGLVTGTILSTTDAQSACLIPEGVNDALVLLAGADLLLGKEALRYDSARQGQSRDAAEVPADALGTLSKRWRDEGLRRISAERMKLAAIHGWKM